MKNVAHLYLTVHRPKVALPLFRLFLEWFVPWDTNMVIMYHTLESRIGMISVSCLVLIIVAIALFLLRTRNFH